MSRIHLSAPDVGAAESERVLAALQSGWVAPLGPDVEAFEAEIAARSGRAHAVATSSGTAALHLALAAWGVGPGDTVLVSTLTFVATANAVAYTGAQPAFADVAEGDGNITADHVDRALRELTAAGRRVPVVIPVDLLGRCVDYRGVEEAAARHGARVLSDAAESLGARYGDRPAGSAGEAAVLSFNGNKIATTSGGGMLLTDDAALAARVRHLATQAREPVPYYEHREVGYNYRLSNVLAALGRAQLARLEEMIEVRRRLRDRYEKLFAQTPGVRILGREGDGGDNCWLTAIIVDPALSGWEAEELRVALEAADIESRPLWKPMHLQPVYADAPAVLDGTAQRLFERGLALPSGSGMSAADLERIDAAVTAFLAQRAGRGR